MEFYEGFTTGERRTGRTTETIAQAAEWLIKDGPRSVVLYAATEKEMQRLAVELRELLKAHAAEMRQAGHVYRYAVDRTRANPRGGAFPAEVLITSDLYFSGGRFNAANELHIADHFAIEQELSRIKEKIDWLRRLHRGASIGREKI